LQRRLSCWSVVTADDLEAHNRSEALQRKKKTASRWLTAWYVSFWSPSNQACLRQQLEHQVCS
jgi:hypothetical protein